MNVDEAVAKITRRRVFLALGPIVPTFLAVRLVAHGQDKSGFPDGYNAVQAAPKSHRVIFENLLVRVLEVILPPLGASEPMHHHRWPSFFLSWDQGGKTPRVRYFRPDGSVRDEPSVGRWVHPGRWSIGWMDPEPMHAIQTVDRPEHSLNDPPLLRIEIKSRA